MSSSTTTYKINEKIASALVEWVSSETGPVQRPVYFLDLVYTICMEQILFTVKDPMN